ncbi:MAG: sensor histidine kinase [Planctomycetota bacterium]|jgi:signal transduction histidine kinase
MFSKVIHKFYLIGALLSLLFLVGYAQLAFFLNNESHSAIRGQEAVFIEREIRSLEDTFYQIRFWEKSVLSEDNPEAEKKFGVLMEQMSKRLRTLVASPIDEDIREGLKQIPKFMTQYGKAFNQIIQLKTEQRWNQTLFDSNYQSLISNVLRSNDISLLRPLFNLSHFQKSYLSNHRESEYHALKVVMSSLENKLLRKELIDDRLKGYVETYKNILHHDFSLEQEIQQLSNDFDEISIKLTRHFGHLSDMAGGILRTETHTAEILRNRLNQSFIISMALGMIGVLFIFTFLARQIVHPIRAIADVARNVRAGNIDARFPSKRNQRDEVVRLGLDLNNMLDTLEKKNEQLFTYQQELEGKVRELALREEELQSHRQHLSELVEERTADLRRTNKELQQEILEREKAEEALRLAHRELELKATALEEANDELSQYAYIVAHDIRSPLRAIRNYTDFLREDLEGSLAGEQEEYLDGLCRAVLYSEELVDDLLELSKVGSRSDQIETIAMGVFLKELIASLNLPPDVEVVMKNDWPTIDAEPTLLRQIFQNLITNAITFNNSPHKLVEIDWLPIGDEHYELFVRDNGIGIEPRHQEQIFRVFQRLHTSEEYEGTGIGLAIVRKATSKLHGSVRLESKPEEGSTFYVTLPKTHKGK